MKGYNGNFNTGWDDEPAWNVTPPIAVVAAVKRIGLHGPDRILVDREGTALNTKRALQEEGYSCPDYILIRNDGWTLGFYRELMDVAYRLWADQWIAFIERPSHIARPISEFPL